MADNLGGNSQERLKEISERLSVLEAAKREAMEDIRDVYAEAKSDGFDVKALRRAQKRKTMDAEKKRKEEETEAIADSYCVALGMIV